VSAEDLCVDWRDWSFAPSAEDLTSTCTQFGGTLSYEGRCSSAGAVGSCRVVAYSGQTRHYGSGASDIEQARSDCAADNGTWSGGPN
jgi:hypothetical protein